MLSLGKQKSNNQNDGYVEMFGIIPSVGTCSIVVTASATINPALVGGSLSFTSVDQLSPVKSVTPAYGDSTSIQAVPTGAVGDIFVDATCCGSPMSTSLQTLRVQQNHDSNTGAGNLSMSTALGAASATMGYTCQSDWWGIIAVTLRAS
jgi:hypothetical protein